MNKFRFLSCSLFILLYVLFSSCGSSPYPGYRKVSDRSYLKLISFSGSERKIKMGDVIQFDLVIEDSAGSMIFYGRDTMTIRDKVMQDHLLELSDGDSAIFVERRSSTWTGHEPKAHIKIVKVQTREEYLAEQKHIAEVGDVEESKVRNAYLDEIRKKGEQPEEAENGLYVVKLEKGNGDSVKAGNIIVISYKGFFTDGRQFDATREPLEFVYGTEMQVLEGMHKALARMREGDKSKIIIPSHFAYGEKGSTTGIVPPFTTLVYEVKVEKVKQKK